MKRKDTFTTPVKYRSRGWMAEPAKGTVGVDQTPEAEEQRQQIVNQIVESTETEVWI
jgi:hypothetical protein